MNTRERKGTLRAAWALRVVVCLVLFVGRANAQSPPATLTQTVSDGVETITLQMTKQSVRGPNFNVKVQNASGGYDDYTPDEVRTYLGTVDEYPGASAAGYLQSDGTFLSMIVFDRGKTWWATGDTVREMRGTGTAVYNYPTEPTVSEGHAGTTTYEYGVGIDVDYRAYSQRYGSSVANAVQAVEFNTAQLQIAQISNVLIKPMLGRVIIRAVQAYCPYDGTTGTAILPLLRDEWNNNQADALTYCFKVGCATPAIGGGVAYGSGRFTVNAADADGDFIVVWRHEVGHNWGVADNDAANPEGATIMCGNQYHRHCGPGVRDILNHRDNNMGWLTGVGTYSAVDLPPYAALESIELEWAAPGQDVTVDILANDFDANAHTLTLLSFEPTSELGRTVTLSAGTGPGGRDQLIYTSEPGGPVGELDSFHYTLLDSSGQTATGVVVTKAFLRNDLKGYWPLDESSGTNAGDLSRNGANGTLEGGMDFSTNGGPGVHGGALTFDGADDDVKLPGLYLNSNTVTVTAWIRRNGTQASWAGLFFSRAAGTTAGFNFGTANELRYHWNGGKYGWNSGLVVPDDTWTFVALVIEPTRATIYMNPGTGMQSAVNNTTHDPEAFGGTAYLGYDPNSSTRRLNGRMDEVRVYDMALTPVEITDLCDGNVWAHSPYPRDGLTVCPLELSWVPYGDAVKYHVYFGTDYTAVQNATPASPEYLGETTTASYPAPSMEDDVTYYWRVDTELAAGTVPGYVWSFTKAPYVPPTPYGDWRFDDGSGPIATDSSGNGNDGTINGAQWTPGFIGTGLLFDGVDDSVTFGTGPSLNGPIDFTVSAWIKTAATATGVIMQQRNGGFNGEYQFSVNANGTLQFMLYQSGYQFNFATAQTVNDDAWHHVVAVRSGLDGHIYIDGNPTPAASASGTAVKSLVNTISTAVGRDIRDNNRPFNGLIDEVRLYNVALAGSEVEYLYNGYFGGNTPPQFTSDPIIEPDATEDSPYSGTIADDATDPDAGDTLTFSKVAGPAWLAVAADGTLSGTPANADVGLNSWTVEVNDGHGGADQAALQIMVVNTNDPPTFTSDPIVEPDATEDSPYSGTIADDATDPDAGDTLTFSKASGPAWLTVAPDGALSGTPGAGDVGLNSWTVQVDDGHGGVDQATLEITVLEAGAPTDTHAGGEIARTGTVSGTYVDTQTQDDVHESITEVYSGLRSQLEHVWEFNLPAGAQTFYIDAYYTDSGDPDTGFVFSWSTSPDGPWTDMLTVTKTADDDVYQTFGLGSPSAVVYVRVLDNDRTKKASGLDTIHVDELFIRTTVSNQPPLPATNPSPPDGATGVGTEADLGWTAGAWADGHDVYFGTNPTPGPGEFQGNQAETTFDPGSLAPNTMYYWRIDETNGYGTTTGEVWSFTTGAGAPQMYVNDIAMAWRSAGKNYFGQATVWIKDTAGANVEGATVSGQWSGSVNGPASGVTLADGTVLIESPSSKGGGTFTFTVVDVVKSALTYNPALNVETSDSITAP